MLSVAAGLRLGAGLKAGIVATGRSVEQRLRASALVARAGRVLMARAAKRSRLARELVRLRVMRIF